MKEPISHPKLQYDIDFWQVHMLHRALSEYLSKSVNSIISKIYFL